MHRLLLSASVLLCCSATALAGLHYSGEPMAELPSQWRGFLADLRVLRNLAVPPTDALPASPLRKQYQEEVVKLQEAAAARKLTAAEQADLGALLIRLGETEQALRVLRQADREHPKDHRIVANLGTAWQHAGNLDQAAEALRQAVELAPKKFREAEMLHLNLVRLRQRQPRDHQELDDLFGVRFVGESGRFEPGKLAAVERKKLPPDAVARMQQLCLWLPHDGRLLWQLGELANAHGDVRAASDIFETCVGQFALGSRTLREHRLQVREAAAELARLQKPGSESAKAEHAGHAGMIATKSRRPLAGRRLDPSSLPPVNREGVNPLPWLLLLETQLDRSFRPTFPARLKELDRLQVSLTGFLQPLTDDLESSGFLLIEYPTGCWYCEMPEVTGIVYVEIAGGKSVSFTRNMMKVTGRLKVNATDPEDFLFTIQDARVSQAD